MTAASAPSISIKRLHLGTVQLPEQHPRASEGTCTIDGFLIEHPDGAILVDTGVADDHPVLNDLYHPTAVPIVDALNAAGVDERDLAAIVNTHLHFDHCGQNRFLPGVPIYVQAAEVAAAEIPRFTIPEWAHIDDEQRRLLDGDEVIVPGVTIVATPGHTPGHQSVVVDHDDDRRSLVVGQACYTCAEFHAGTPFDGDAHDEAHLSMAVESVQRLRALAPSAAYFSHDRTTYAPSADT